MVLNQTWLGLLRWLGRAVGFAASGFLLLISIGEGVMEISSGQYSVVPLLLALLVPAVGLVIALWRERVGSLVVLLGSGLLALTVGLLAGRDVWALELVFVGPFLCSGLLLLACSYGETR
jgi:hypothetical protein